MSFCACRVPKPGEVTEERFEPLFGETPVETYRMVICEKCGGLVAAWRPVKEAA